MSRSEYSDDCEHVWLYRQAVQRAATGYRGQHLLRRLAAALDAMPEKRLIAGEIKDEAGDVCAFGALDPDALYADAESLAKHFGIARSLAAEIVYQNDEVTRWRHADESPEERWGRMRQWVEGAIASDANVPNLR